MSKRPISNELVFKTSERSFSRLGGGDKVPDFPQESGQHFPLIALVVNYEDSQLNHSVGWYRLKP